MHEKGGGQVGVLRLDICNYDKEVVCPIYDSRADVSGQAYNVFISSERNGWKELSVSIPTTCATENCEEENYRLQYLIAEYKVRAIEYIDGVEKTDWYIISEPKITHNNFSKTTEVRAPHCSIILNARSMELEFSDDEANNVGTAEEILTTILEPTEWHIGNVADFYEDDGSVKVRSMNASSKTGAFRLIEQMCELFEAKPVYHGEGVYFDKETGEYKVGLCVDILPMNPFSKTEEGEIPVEVLRSDGPNVLELRYRRNMKNLSRTVNTENIRTRLRVYGNYGDLEGFCSVSTAKHREYTWTASDYSAGQEFCVDLGEGAYRYFTLPGNITSGQKLIYSDLDYMSQSYIWNKNCL